MRSTLCTLLSSSFPLYYVFGAWGVGGLFCPPSFVCSTASTHGGQSVASFSCESYMKSRATSDPSVLRPRPPPPHYVTVCLPPVCHSAGVKRRRLLKLKEKDANPRLICTVRTVQSDLEGHKSAGSGPLRVRQHESPASGRQQLHREEQQPAGDCSQHTQNLLDLLHMSI